MAKKLWIAGAISAPGALRKQLGATDNIPKAKLQKAAKAKGTLGRRARLALTLAKLPEPSQAARKAGAKKAVATKRRKKG